MGTIISNGTLPYRYNSLILRTPLYVKLSLKPSAQFNYDVGSDYVQSLPTRDFPVQSGSQNYGILAGHNMRRSYLLRAQPAGAVQIWRQNNLFSSTYDSGFVWYGGNYSPAIANTVGAAFLRVPAYNFQIPSKYSSWSIDSATLTTLDHGTTMTVGACGQVKTKTSQYPIHPWTASTTVLPSNNPWRNKARQFQLGVVDSQTLNRTDAVNIPVTQSITINMQNTDSIANAGAKNAFPLWIDWPSGAVKYTDGCIINAPSNPHTQTHTLGQDAINTMNQTGGNFNVVLKLAVGDSGQSGETSNDYPTFHTYNTTAWWMCERVQITKLDLVLRIGEV